ncbi:MAG: hypothetical protein QOH61_217 [Chloroflexota bacterium]|nr:hypothetical protein [Chloroflexota bacterium]
MALVAVLVGLAIAWADSRPGWDDTAITAASLWLAGAAFAFLGRHRPWLWTVLVAGWIPLLEIGGPTGLWSLLALVFAFGGAALGTIVVRWLVLDERIRDHR